jgi:hypothetical protein
MHEGTEHKIKTPIATLFQESPFCDELIFIAREYQLDGTKFRADFAYQTKDGGWLFVEDDDAQRCLSNFIKYWRWAECHVDQHVSLLHLIGPRGDGPLLLLEFVRQKSHAALPNFSSQIVQTANWETSEWIGKFKDAALLLPPFNKP